MKKINFKPFPTKEGHRVLINQDKAEEKTASGIILPGAQEAPLRGVVVEVSEGCEDPKIGERVQWQRFREQPVKVEGENYVVVETLELHGKFL